MMNNLDIPITPDTITPAWLTEALRSTGTIQKTAVKSLHIEPLISPAFLDLGHRYGSNVAKISTRLSQPPITLIHQDMHVENLLFGVKDDDKPLVFIDWQFCGYGRGVTDVAHFIIYSLPSDLRRQAESSLLQTYHSLLIKHGVQGYDFEQCWTDYQQAFFRNLFGLTAAVSLFDMSRPHAQAFVKAGLSRLHTFSTDHDVSKFL